MNGISLFIGEWIRDWETKYMWDFCLYLLARVGILENDELELFWIKPLERFYVNLWFHVIALWMEKSWRVCCFKNAFSVCFYWLFVWSLLNFFLWCVIHDGILLLVIFIELYHVRMYDILKRPIFGSFCMVCEWMDLCKPKFTIWLFAAFQLVSIYAMIPYAFMCPLL